MIDRESSTEKDLTTIDKLECEVERLEARVGQLEVENARLREACEAVLIFHAGGEWTSSMQNRWLDITQSPDATTRGLCETIRAVIAKATNP